MWILWLAIFYGSGGLTMTHQRFDTKEECEAAARDVIGMFRSNLEAPSRSMHIKWVCSGGASRHQVSE